MVTVAKECIVTTKNFTVDINLLQETLGVKNDPCGPVRAIAHKPKKLLIRNLAEMFMAHI